MTRRRMAGAAAWLFAVATGCNLLIGTDELGDRKCPAGQKACPEVGECVSITSADTGCARDGCAPCSVEHGRATCDETNACKLFDCQDGYLNCYSDTACDTDIAHDANNCGFCGHECPPTPNAHAGCSGGRCTSGGCVTGYKDCNGSGDGNDADGCEIGPDAPCPAASPQSP